MFPIGRRVKIFVSPLEGGLRSDDSDEYQTPSEGMTMTSIRLRKRDSQSRDCTIVTLLNPPSVPSLKLRL
jgi:hypothetical protein